MENMMQTLKLSAGFLLAALLSATANAALVSGTSLQNGLNAITQGGSFLDVNADQMAYDEIWEITSSGGSINTLVFEFAGFANTTTFGIYDVNDITNRLEIFNGPDSSGSVQVTLNFGTPQFVSLDSSGAVTDIKVFSTTRFGYYLDSSAQSGGGLFYSEEALNSDVADAAHGGTGDHMVAYAGGTGLQLDIFDTGSYAAFAAGEFILAWEDLAFPSSDYDYSDMVVLVESVQVPEPVTLGLLGLGLLGLGVARRRRLV